MQLEHKHILSAIQTLDSNKSWRSFATMLLVIVCIVINGTLLLRMATTAPKDVLFELKEAQREIHDQFMRLEERQLQIQESIIASQTAFLSFTETVREYKDATKDRWTAEDQREFSEINNLKMGR